MATSDAAAQANRAGLDPKRLVVIFFLVTGLVTALFLDHVLGVVWARLSLRNPEIIEGLGWNVTTILGVLLGGGGAIAGYFHPRTHQLSNEVAVELMRVTWPTLAETRVSTIAVILASVVSAVLIFGIDTLSYKLMVDWLPQLWEKL